MRLQMLTSTCARLGSNAGPHESEPVRTHLEDLRIWYHARMAACDVKVTLIELSEAAAGNRWVVTPVNLAYMVSLDRPHSIERHVASKRHCQVIPASIYRLTNLIKQKCCGICCIWQTVRQGTHGLANCVCTAGSTQAPQGACAVQAHNMNRYFKREPKLAHRSDSSSPP